LINKPEEKDSVRRVRVLRVGADGARECEQPLADEGTVELYVNGRYVAGLVCTMERVRELLVGFLFSEGIILSRGELRDLKTDDGVRYAATVQKLEGGLRPKMEKAIIASGCGHAIVLDGELPVEICHKEIDHEITYTREEILAIGHALVESGGIHRETRGTHGAAILKGAELIVAAEDISRHNAVDKVVGHCRLKNIPLGDKALATTGRISSEIVRKLIRNRMHIIVSRTVPTAAAVDLADHFLVTTVGAMTKNSFTVYTQPFRVIPGGRR